jgi:uncharacterized metal-binding protein YceD (DUF177 family)
MQLAKPTVNSQRFFHLYNNYSYLCRPFLKLRNNLGRFDLYKVDLKNMQQDIQKHEYLLDSQFFANIGGEDIQKGRINTKFTVSKKGSAFDLSFAFSGTVIIPCDRCLDDMDLPVETSAHLIVKFGKDYSEESDEIVVIPETEGIINLAWFLYEFIALAIPIKHVHAPGKCNKQMTTKLKKHSVKSDDNEQSFDSDDTDDIIITDDNSDDEEKTDPRWDALRGLKEE